MIFKTALVIDHTMEVKCDIEIANINDVEYKIRVCVVDDVNLYCASDIGKALRLTNIHSSMCSVPMKEKKFIICNTNGGKQQILFISPLGLRLLLSKSRTISAIHLANYFKIDVINIHNVSIESGTLNNIVQAFSGETMLPQYQVGSYRIDLYFTDYKLAVECDEKHHINSETYDTEREIKIQSSLGCTFLRYQPQSPDFDIFKVINQIFRHIQLSKTHN